MRKASNTKPEPKSRQDRKPQADATKGHALLHPAIVVIIVIIVIMVIIVMVVIVVTEL